MCRMCFIMMLTFKCLTNENRSEHRKDESLDECNQYLNKINKYCKCYGENRCPPSGIYIQLCKNENE